MVGDFANPIVPFAFRENDRKFLSGLELFPGHVHGRVNVGSIGQSRDGVAKATYVVYDMNEQTIELRRLDYDIPKTQAKILAAGLPPRLAERLALGK